jgi:alginate O-acetyltransferase complex protein AlgJ
MLTGAILAVESGRLVGWTADSDDLDRTLSVDVHIDGKLVRKGLADRWSDAAASMTGDGRHGFAVKLPARVLDGGRHYISATVAGQLTLPIDPTWSASDASQPDGTRFERMSWGADAPTLPDPRLLEGLDGWAFLCDDANGNLDQLLGDLAFTEPDLRDYREILLGRHEALARLGIPYLFAVPPSKETIHPEYLPATDPPLRDPRPLGQLRQALADTEVRILDMHASMRAAARAGAELYYRRDCHWNFAGALVASQALLAGLREAGFPDASLDERELSPDEREPAYEDVSVKGDLTGKERVALVEGRLVPASSEMEPVVREPDRKPVFSALGLRRLETPEHLQVSKTRETVILANERRPDGPRAIVYRDSFGDYLQPFVSSAFSQTTWLWTRTIDMPLIKRERPDVVIQVVAERFLAQIPYGDVKLARIPGLLPPCLSRKLVST